MAQYVCDYGQVTAIGEKLCQAASELESAVNSYSSSIDGNLSSWTGVAKNNFASSNQAQVQASMSDAEYMRNLGEYIKEVSTQIQAVDDELASISI